LAKLSTVLRQDQLEKWRYNKIESKLESEQMAALSVRNNWKKQI